MGTTALKQGQEYERFPLLRASAEQGYPLAIGWVGYCLLNGVGVAKSETKAIKYFAQGSELGDRFSSYWLGMCYQQGRGVEKDEQLAVVYLEKSAEKDSFNGLSQLCQLYSNSSKDLSRYIMWGGRYIGMGGYVKDFGDFIEKTMTSSDIGGANHVTEKRKRILFELGKAMTM